MKNLVKALCLTLALAGIAKAVSSLAGNQSILLGINSNTAGYTGNTVYTFVDPASVAASLIVSSLTATGNLTVSGSMAVTGNIGATSGTNETLSGYQAYTPTFQVTVATNVSISPTASFMLIQSTGGPVFFGQTSSYPAISTSSAVNGQWLVISSTASGNAVYITTSAATAVTGSNPQIVFTSTMSAVSFIYSSSLSQWMEVGKQ